MGQGSLPRTPGRGGDGEGKQPCGAGTKTPTSGPAPPHCHPYGATSLPTFYTLPPTPSLYVPPEMLFPIDSEVTERLQNISLTKIEGKAIALNPSRRTQTLDDCSLSFVGRFLIARDVNHRATKNLLRSAWKLGNDL